MTLHRNATDSEAPRRPGSPPALLLAVAIGLVGATERCHKISEPASVTPLDPDRGFLLPIDGVSDQVLVCGSRSATHLGGADSQVPTVSGVYARLPGKLELLHELPRMLTLTSAWGDDDGWLVLVGGEWPGAPGDVHVAVNGTRKSSFDSARLLHVWPRILPPPRYGPTLTIQSSREYLVVQAPTGWCLRVGKETGAAGQTYKRRPTLPITYLACVAALLHFCLQLQTSHGRWMPLGILSWLGGALALFYLI